MQYLVEQSRPLVMGILNVTPDSFSDGGCYLNKSSLRDRIQTMINDGADIIDIGGESTRPGAEAVPLQVELDRVLPAVELTQSMTDLPISVDTYKPEVMRHALLHGVEIINDINALQSPGALELIADSNAYVCLMHKQGHPKNMQLSPVYNNTVEEVSGFLLNRVAICEKMGINRKRIFLDPGFGFGKTLKHNIELFHALPLLSSLGFPLLVGVSRKSMLGDILGNIGVEKRLVPSVVSAVLAAQQGVKILRVHDVKETKQALKLLDTLVIK